jgi:nucleotide-binding universal stress UspA family protein
MIEELCPSVVVWAVDVGETEESNAAIENLIEEITENRRVVVEPVHILVPEITPLPRQLFSKWSEDLVYDRAEQIRSVQRPNRLVRGPRVIKRQNDSRAGAVEMLLEYADQVGADLIIAKSSRRNPFVRAIRPGFTDELISRSSVPVLLFKENSRSGSLPVSLHLPVESAA